MIAPGIFTPPVVYDGRKNIFAPRELPFADGVQEVCTPFPLPWSFDDPIAFSLVLAWCLRVHTRLRPLELLLANQRFIGSS